MIESGPAPSDSLVSVDKSSRGPVPLERGVVVAAEKKRRSPLRRLMLALLLGTLAMVPMSAAFLAIAPGVMTWTAPVLCDSNYSDAFAVSDQYNVRPGETSWTFELTCINDRGEADVVGFLRPMLVVGAGLPVALGALSLLGSFVGWARRD